MSRIGLQLDVMPYNMVMQLQGPDGRTGVRQRLAPGEEREKKKSPFEITLMEKAAAIAKKVYARVPEVLHEGMSEIELGGIMESYCQAPRP